MGHFLAYLMALKAAMDINQKDSNVNLGVKAITDVKKSTKAFGRQTFGINFDKEWELT